MAESKTDRVSKMHYTVVSVTSIVMLLACFVVAHQFSCSHTLQRAVISSSHCLGKLWTSAFPVSETSVESLYVQDSSVSPFQLTTAGSRYNSVEELPGGRSWLLDRQSVTQNFEGLNGELDDEMLAVESRSSVQPSRLTRLLHSLKGKGRRLSSGSRGRRLGEGDVSGGAKLFPPCESSMTDFTPCQDPETMKKYRGAERMDRHCPDKGLDCLIPAPVGYRKPMQWPTSRDEAWFVNVPYKHLTTMKADQNWIRYDEAREKFTFPGGGTMFHHGAEEYLKNLEKLIPLTDGTIRTALDTGCGVGSFGAFLLSRNVQTMSLAPRDGHEAQVQFALERGLPAMLGVLAKNRLPYPARAFDMAHCSRCLIPWSSDNGRLLAEIDRVLRPGGFWVLTGPPIDWQHYAKGWNRTKEDLSAEQDRLEATAQKLCWRKYKQEGMFAIWQKPLGDGSEDECLKSLERKEASGKALPICEDETQVDLSWYTPMNKCLAPLPPASPLQPWPERLTATPPRIAQGLLQLPTPQADPGSSSSTGSEGRDLAASDDEGSAVDEGVPKRVLSESEFQADTARWTSRVEWYKSTMLPALGQGMFRNLLDASAGLGGFAAALKDDPVWVMNVVPVEGRKQEDGSVQARVVGGRPDTLGVVYERGLLGTYHDWCEAFSSYPRTYDLIHAADLLSTIQASQRCSLEQVLLEMDRLLRPEGAVIVADRDEAVLQQVKDMAAGLRWDARFEEAPTGEEGGEGKEKVLVCMKKYWTDA